MLNNEDKIDQNNKLTIEERSIYTDGIQEYLVVKVDIASKTISYILNPFACELLNETLEEQEVYTMSLDVFQDIIFGVYVGNKQI